MASIIWLPSAKDTYAEILEKLGMDTALRLDDKVEHLISKLETFTQLCPSFSKNSSFRKCTIDRNISLMYSTDKQTVYLIAFFYQKSNFPF